MPEGKDVIGRIMRKCRELLTVEEGWNEESVKRKK